ncbi:OprO/OprP family phosphate-selective porin [Acetobacter sp. AN02]|uniref:OprO/OprP family phosphate-selective porin n=1 Tax=Acetobacter sp. AN02 TaxID=2894186 RepID=UPI0024345B7D|nr:porin [Acetobacter sp. AN02]MDG6095417.1 OprO/OprP family phosphate-selective porin [Acetobacter sp. AN02]
MTVSPRFLLASFTVLSGASAFFSTPVLAASSDQEVIELRREMAEMRREMASMRAELHHDQHGRATSRTASGHHRAGATTVADRRDYNGAPEQGIQFDRPSSPGVKFVHHVPGDGRPPSDRGISSSWEDFQKASSGSEVVQIGGMKIGFPNGRPTIQSEDSKYAMSIGLAFHEDFGGFMGVTRRGNESKGNFNDFTSNARRLRIPFTFRYKDWVANVTPDFGAGNNDGTVGLYEANLNYAGLRNTILTVGYFQPRVTEEDSESSNDFMMMERPGITDIVRNIAAGDARFVAGGLHYEKRWWIAGYFTGQQFGHRNGNGYYGGNGTITDSQTGGMIRVAGRPIATRDWDLHLGVSALSSFKQDQSSAGRTFSLAERPEINLGESTLLTTGSIPDVGSVWSAGPEAGLRWKRLLLKGEYYHIGITRSRGNGGEKLPSLAFDGWYGAANYTIFGNPRMYNYKEGAFSAPSVSEKDEFNPMAGHWGALEISGRYSETDLNSNLNNPGGVRGGRQIVWTGGLNWYPNRHFRVMLDFNHFIVSRSDGAGSVNSAGRNGNSLAARIQAAF